MAETAGRGTSWVSVVLGWLAALGAALILSSIVGAIVGALFVALGAKSGTTGGGISGLIGAAVGASFIDQLGGVTLPGPASKVAQNVPRQGLSTIFSISGILALLFPFIGGALGGARGAGVGQERPYPPSRRDSRERTDRHDG